MATATKTDYINGSDVLISAGGAAFGHCTTATITLSVETKEHAVKPVASAPLTKALWKDKSVSGMSMSISAEGLGFYEETENGYKQLMKATFDKGAVVDVTAFERGNDTKPFLSGKFVVTSIERTDPAQDDVTYKIQLENKGEVKYDDSGLTTTTPTAGA